MSDTTTVAPRNVQINLRHVRRPADVGVARASIFLGLAANAVAVKPPISHVLDDRVRYQFVPSEVTSETLSGFHGEFISWIVGSALRELVDAFSAFLVNTRPILHLMESKEISESDWIRLSAEIEQKNISQQYKQIQDILDLDRDFAEMFETFRQARNCLSHRRGVVALRDVDTVDGQLVLRWCFLGTFLKSSDGTEVPIDNDTIMRGLAVAADESVLGLRRRWKEKSFPVGTQIVLTRHDLAEICFGVHIAIEHVAAKMHEFAGKHGIPDADAENVLEPEDLS